MINTIVHRTTALWRAYMAFHLQIGTFEVCWRHCNHPQRAETMREGVVYHPSIGLRDVVAVAGSSNYHHPWGTSIYALVKNRAGSPQPRYCSSHMLYSGETPCPASSRDGRWSWHCVQ